MTIELSHAQITAIAIRVQRVRDALPKMKPEQAMQLALEDMFGAELVCDDCNTTTKLIPRVVLELQHEPAPTPESETAES